MKELNKCLDLRQRISDLNNLLEDIACRIRYPKAQTISDMPRLSSGGGNPIERYILQQEKYETRKKAAETELNDTWNAVVILFNRKKLHKDEILLMRLRFYYGYQWKQCAAIMREKYGDTWNENKVFRTYRKVVKTLQE